MLKELSEHLLTDNYTHCLVCWSPNEEQGGFIIHHICGYPNKPSKNAIENLINELRIDESFHMSDMIYGQDYQVSLLDTNELGAMEGMIVETDLTTKSEPIITEHGDDDVSR